MFIKVLSVSLIAFFSMAGFSGRADAFPGEPFEQYRLKFGTPSNASPSALRKAPAFGSVADKSFRASDPSGLGTGRGQIVPRERSKGRKVGSENVNQFYWMEAEADPFLTGKKLKGNLVVLFKKSPVKEPGSQTPGSLNLISTREIYLVRVNAEAFDSLLESFSEKWKIVSKRGHIHSFRSLDRSRTNRSAQTIHPAFGPVADKSFRANDPKTGRSERPYDLYQLVSADRRFNAEMSYSPLEAIVPLPSGSSKTTTPVFNLWIYITQTH